MKANRGAGWRGMQQMGSPRAAHGSAAAMLRQLRRQKSRSSSGFLMTLEAASAIILLLVASLSLPLFAFPKSNSGDFFLCADTALALSKKGSFSSGSLQGDLDCIKSLSGLCVEAGPAVSSPCGPARLHAGETISISIPAYNGLLAERALIRCWRE